MRVLRLAPASPDGHSAQFSIDLEADDGSRHRLVVPGRQLDLPVQFARYAEGATGRRCTAAYAGDDGGWQAHLGALLRRTTVDRPKSNAEFGGRRLDDDRRRALLSSTTLGQATMTAEEAAAVPAPEPEQRPLTFIEKVQRQEAEAARQRHQRLAQYLKLTPLGRDILQQDAQGG